MPDVDLVASIAGFVEAGAGCDCEILLNIAVPAWNAADAAWRAAGDHPETDA